MSGLSTSAAVDYLNAAKEPGERNLIGRASLLKLANTGKIPYLNVGGRYVFSQASLDKWLAAFTEQAQP